MNRFGDRQGKQRIQHSGVKQKDISDLVRPRHDNRSERRRIRDETRNAIDNYNNGYFEEFEEEDQYE